MMTQKENEVNRRNRGETLTEAAVDGIQFRVPTKSTFEEIIIKATKAALEPSLEI